jgi:hypothetical protein
MNRTEWLGCHDPMLMLGAVRQRASDRKLQLFARACCRRAADLFAPDHAAQARLLFEDDSETGWTASGAPLAPEPTDPFILELAFCLTDVSSWNAATAVLQRIARAFAELCAGAGEAVLPLADIEFEHQVALAHDLFDHLFRPAPLLLAWVEGHPHLVALARTIYEERTWSEMPVLADALEEAGCAEDDVLEHSREHPLHARGCWVLDAVLARF